jgi:hypothetical protein
MPNTLSTFLTRVATDPKVSISYHKDPMTTINSSPLSQAARAAILTKDPVKIRAEIEKEKGVTAGGLNAAGDTEVVLVIVI